MPGRVQRAAFARPDSPLPAWAPVARAEQETATTASRRAQPRAWMRAVRWLISTQPRSRASATTLRVAADLARRMDYTDGRVLYDLAGTARRLDVSVPTVKRHVRILREAGLLVWLEHGTRKNLRLPGRKYAGTATVYGAAIPPVFDEAMGHRIAGDGYDDRRIVGVTEAGRERAVNSARTAVTSRGQELDPPSPGRCRKSEKAWVSDGLNNTPRAVCSTSSTPKKTTTSRRGRPGKGRGTGRPALQVARDIAIARRVRPRVAWAQHEGLRRLAFALRPLIDAGLDADSITVELHSWWLDWRPAKPAAFITAEIRRRADRDAELPSAPTAPTPEFLAAAGPAPNDGDDGQEPGIREGRVRLEDLPRDAVVALRSAATTDPGLITAAIEELGMRDARRLYTGHLVDQALRAVFRVSRRAVLHR